MLPEATRTRETFQESLHISFSSLTTYLTCPRRYRYHYVEGQAWEFIPSALAFGGAIHRAAAWFYGHVKQTGRKPELPEVLDEFRRCWKDELREINLRYKDEETSEGLLGKGEEALALFYQEREPQRIEAVEYPFSVELMDSKADGGSGYKLVGVFDLIESDDRGNLIISELKTAARRQDEDQVRNHLQAALYSYALKQLGFTTTARQTLVRFDVLVKTKKPVLQSIYLTKGDEDHRRMVDLAGQILRAIELGVFYPNYGWWCNECPFQKRCTKDL